jgi:hypothetical protein
MTPHQARRRQRRRPRDGRAAPNAPAGGWPRIQPAFVNARVPSVPTTLDLRLNEYFAGAIVMGLMAAADREPNTEWAQQWAFNFGEKMAAEAYRRRREKPARR